MIGGTASCHNQKSTHLIAEMEADIDLRRCGLQACRCGLQA
jgi:hypothetical protein